jgi:hypothetical protein
MNSHVRRFYRTFVDEESPVRFYHEVIALHESPNWQWEEIQQKMPSFPKGWYELARLSLEDRIEFVREFWLSTLPFVSHIHAFLNAFFDKLDDIGVYLTQSQFDSEFHKRDFNDVLPEDYLSFLKIHDRFSKHSDTGIIRSSAMRSTYEKIQEKIQNEPIYSGKQLIDPKELIPFYESFGQPSFQCFYLGWTPMNGVGNVYFSMAESSISDVHDQNSLTENLAFPSFLDWLIFYLEAIEN